MTSPDVSEDENGPPSPATPRRTPVVKRNQHATPGRRTSAGMLRTPKSAPVKPRTNIKQSEPTLFTDFLLGRADVLGRPAPARQNLNRTRRKSLDMVKAEMRAETVKKVQAPGGVKDRVKQWQKVSAAEVIEDPNALASEPDEVDVAVDEDSVNEEDRQRIKMRKARLVKRRSKDETDDENAEKNKSAPGTPKKRVISDEHWKKKSSPPRKGVAIPKNFLKTTAINPPLNKKIEDWAHRLDEETAAAVKTNAKQPKTPAKKTSADDGIRVTPRQAKSADGETPVEKPKINAMKKKKTPPKKSATLPRNFLKNPEANPTAREKMKEWEKRLEIDDSIRPEPSTPTRLRRPSRQDPDGGIRVSPMESKSDGEGKYKEDSVTSSGNEDNIRIQRSRKSASRGQAADENSRAPVQRVQRNRSVSERNDSPNRRNLQETKEPNNTRNFSWAEAGEPSEVSKAREDREKTPESLDEIPFGNSAFSVLDLPAGAEAGNMRKPKPQRNTSRSAAVQNVFKRVISEGKKYMQEAAEPPRIGTNQPPSIESWLNGTSDPFVEGSSTEDGAHRAETIRSFKTNDQSAVDIDDKGSEDSRTRGKSSVQVQAREASQSPPARRDDSPPRLGTYTGEAVKTETDSPSGSPTGLKRTLAKRNTSSPIKTPKKPLKTAFFEAFKGESSSAGWKATSNPFIDMTTQRPDTKSTSRKNSISFDEPLMEEDEAISETNSIDLPIRQQESYRPNSGRRSVPTTGEHPLSTIASVSSFATSESISQTTSEVSHTTITQDTVLSKPMASNLSRSNRGLPKRRLTKHSDLISMLSLPDTAAPGRGKSLKSARSVRTTRTPLDVATVDDLLRELRDDEVKYKRELKTLVDGVIPVLLSSVISQSESAIAAGLLDPCSSDISHALSTKPIVDMGVSLEKIKKFHALMPLDNVPALITWARNAHEIYSKYVDSWRMGFQNVVVNLEPNSRRSSTDAKSTLNEIPQNSDGDAVNTNGERVDVAFLLKRPLVRIKYLAKLTKGLEMLKPSEKRAEVATMYQALEVKCRRRAKEEAAAVVDRAANNTDASRTRDPRTLAQLSGTTINRSRQVCAKDTFSLDMLHSSGQRVACRVEIILRDNPSDMIDDGDMLVCAVDDVSRWLLFPPILRSNASARIGKHKYQIIMMIRGSYDMDEWDEAFVLDADDSEAAADWVDMVGSKPMPPLISSNDCSSELYLNRSQSLIFVGRKEVSDGSLSPRNDIEVPIGERRQRVSRAGRSTAKESSLPPTTSQIRETAISKALKEEAYAASSSVRDLNDAMRKASNSVLRSGDKCGNPPTYHGPTRNLQGSVSLEKAPATVNPSGRRRIGRNSDLSVNKTRKQSPLSNVENSVEGEPASSCDWSEATESTITTSTESTDSTESTRTDGAPPPPAHKRPVVPKSLGKTPTLDNPAPKALNRRSSSPLKHEYQPSEASDTSETSSSSESSDSESEYSSTDSSDDEDLEAVDLPESLPPLDTFAKRASPAPSIYSFQNASLAPSNSASQGPYRGVPKQPAENTQRIVAMISSWSDKKGRWEDLYPEACTIIIGPGLIQAFENDSPYLSRDNTKDDDAEEINPLVALVLTPLVSLRQSTALDIEIQSPPTAQSKLKCSGTVRYRTMNVGACQELYQAIHRARLENPVYKKLEQERLLASYGGHSYEAAVAGNRRRSWFGRRRSYRASTRAPSTAQVSESSGGASGASSAFSALKRLSGSSVFNIAKSSVGTTQGGHGASASARTSLYSSSDSGFTPPRTPTSPSLSLTGTSTSAAMVNLGSENLKIRLYQLETSTKWNDMGTAYLTITTPPRGMRQASSLYHGIEKRIIVSRNALDGSEGLKTGNTAAKNFNNMLLDAVLGSGCFSKVGRTGIAVNIWADLVGDNGEVGMAATVGGVSGTTRKWMLQCSSTAQSKWIFGLVAVGR